MELLHAGIAWSADGYEVEIIDPNCRTLSVAAFDNVDEVVRHLRDAGEGVVAVVESGLGVVDGRLMAAGIEVRRVDPAITPQRPTLASSGAGRLARISARRSESIRRLERDRGTQTGLEPLLAEMIDASQEAVSALATNGRCVSRGAGTRRQIALTFDDGPQEPYTGQVLDVLAGYGVAATFFCVGLHARQSPGLLARMRAEGHSIGNHTWSHPFLWELNEEQLRAQIEYTATVIANATGAPPTLFRPPYGSRSPDVIAWFATTDNTMVLWDVEPDDWAMPGPEEIAARVLDTAAPGSIVVMHDGGGDRSQTVAALPLIIEGLLDRGYEFARVDDLAAA